MRDLAALGKNVLVLANFDTAIAHAPSSTTG